MLKNIFFGPYRNRTKIIFGYYPNGHIYYYSQLSMRIASYATSRSKDNAWPTADVFERLGRCSDVTLNMDEDLKTVHVSLPNLCPIDSIDAHGYLNLLSLQTVFAKFRIFATSCLPPTGAYHRDAEGKPVPYLQFLDLCRERLPFQITMETTINKAYYKLPEKAPCKNLQMSYQLGYVGRTSYNTYATLNDARTREVYATCTTQMVNVNTETHKPQRLPAWWVDRFACTSNPNIPNLTLSPFKFPGLASCYKVTRYCCKVNYSDIDYNGHTTHLAYTKFSMQALNYAASRRGGGGVSFDRATFFRAIYANESKAYDNLSVYVWKDDDKQEDEEEEQWKVMIFKRMTLLFQCSIRFN